MMNQNGKRGLEDDDHGGSNLNSTVSPSLGVSPQ